MNIEKVTVEDAEELLSIYAPYVQETAISFECEVPSLEEFRDRIHNISAILPYIKAVENEKVLGYAYAGRFKGRKAYDWSVEVTVYVKKEARRSGIGRMLYTALEDSLKQMGVLNMKDVSIECNDHMQIIALFEKTHEEIERFKKDLDAQAAFVSYEHL